MSNPLQSVYDWYRSAIRNPKYRWWVVLGTMAYLLMPFDFLPDFIPLIGQLDDVVIISLLVSEVSQLLIDRVKSSKEETSQTTVAQADSPVDVNAVKVE
ncbi:MAG TPA: YkvA family protein [Trichocoleus sp.]|jgi:uncharacterized membrane protein YkvA (DUF1232 family)